MRKSSSRGSSSAHRAAGAIADPEPQNPARPKRAMGRPVDTSDIPEITKLGPRPVRDASGRLQKKPLSPIRKAILSALGQRQMTRYRLWRKARALHPTLSESAVYEYLRGERDIGVASVEALMAAAGVKVAPRKPKTTKTTKTKTKTKVPTCKDVGSGK